MKLGLLVTLVAASACLLAGCAATDVPDSGAPDREPVAVLPAVPAADPPAAVRWACNWDPTMNDDWHDDYLCTNGTDVDRPYLIPDDSFVERSEIDQAAAAYEAQLNS